MSVTISFEMINTGLIFVKPDSSYKKHIVSSLQPYVAAFKVIVFMTVNDYALKTHKSNYPSYKLQCGWPALEIKINVKLDLPPVRTQRSSFWEDTHYFNMMGALGMQVPEWTN